MELFTRKYAITETNPDTDEVTEIELTVTNDRSDIVDGEYVAVSYLSPRTGRLVEEIYDYEGEPKEVAALITFVALHEKVDPCYFDVEE